MKWSLKGEGFFMISSQTRHVHEHGSQIFNSLFIEFEHEFVILSLDFPRLGSFDLHQHVVLTLL
ncbi:unnamed protein product [Arabidopsis halleri]